ncbi:hypothetical protein [Nocardioides sp.]|uniref:hypothetical protein n=1 Tax=Nocardioides sp. TaxID=35761 RepID=UPI0035271E12
MDLADALHLDQALAAGAEQLRIAGSTESLDARRATALGRCPGPSSPSPTTTSDRAWRGPSRRRPQRPVTLFLHLSEQALTGEAGGRVGRCENTRTPIDADTIRRGVATPTRR